MRSILPFGLSADGPLPIAEPECLAREGRGELLVGRAKRFLVQARDLGVGVDQEERQAELREALGQGRAQDDGHRSQVHGLPGAVAVDAVAGGRGDEHVVRSHVSIGAAVHPLNAVVEGAGGELFEGAGPHCGVGTHREGAQDPRSLLDPSSPERVEVAGYPVVMEPPVLQPYGQGDDTLVPDEGVLREQPVQSGRKKGEDRRVEIGIAVVADRGEGARDLARRPSEELAQKPGLAEYELARPHGQGVEELAALALVEMRAERAKSVPAQVGGTQGLATAQAVAGTIQFALELEGQVLESHAISTSISGEARALHLHVVGRDRVALARAGDLEDALPAEVDPALLGAISRPLHPPPDGLGEGERTRRMDHRLPDALELPAIEEGEVPDDEIDHLGQKGMALLEAEQPVEDRIVRMLELRDHRVWRARQEQRRVGVGADRQKLGPGVALEGQELGRIVLQELAKGDREGAVDVAVDAALAVEDAVAPDVGLRGGNRDALEDIENGVAGVVRAHIARHALVIEEFEGAVGIEAPEALHAQGVDRGESRLFPGLVDPTGDASRRPGNLAIQEGDVH